MSVAPKTTEAEKKPRGAGGKFVSKGTKPEDTATHTVTVKGPVAVITDALENPADDKPLLAITINNPLHKLLQWIKEIKKKQTTTFEFKIKVPLIALPVFLIVLGSSFTFFFNLGKAAEKQNTQLPMPTPQITIVPTVLSTPIFISRVGIVKGTYQVLGLLAQADNQENVLPATPTLSPTMTPTLTPTPTPSLSRFVLLDKDEKITFLLAAPSIKLGNYLNKRVLVSGWYNQEKNSLEIKKTSDVEVLP